MIPTEHFGGALWSSSSARVSGYAVASLRAATITAGVSRFECRIAITLL
ncbi:hypothetical protein [Mycolicibacterium helvum]|nr:hypothetical protein [Mycolicibacterium helvum]